MESSDGKWRRDVDENLQRLHSLLFGTDITIERGNPSTSLLLGLQLLGFLDSRSQNPIDEALVYPIRRQVLSKITYARRSLAPDSDRQAFEQARRKEGCIFVKRGDVDMDKIKESKYFQPLLCESRTATSDSSISKPSMLKGDTLTQTEPRDKQDNDVSVKSSKVLTQAKLTSLYTNRSLKPTGTSFKALMNSESNNSDESSAEKLNSNRLNHMKGHASPSFVQAEEDKSHENVLRTKRRHVYDTTGSPSSNDNANDDNISNGFVTARVKLEMDARQKQGLTCSPSASLSPSSGFGQQSDNNSTGNIRNPGLRSVGIPRRGIRSNFVPPVRSNGANTGGTTGSRVTGKTDDALEESTRRCLEMLCGPDGELPEKLRNLEPRLIEHVSNEIMDRDPNVRWGDIAGLEHAKKCVTEMVIWPLLRPDIFKGCRSPGRGLLLFGPPGTGKTMIGKAIAGEAKATFFYISASSLTSKWIGEGEKLVRALFGVACCRQPAVIFVDEIDSLLSQRKSEGEHESSRRLKTQFLIEMEGFDSGNEQILLLGATNRPQELDEAARRRLSKRLYIPLPPSEARAWIVRNLLEKDGLFKLSEEDTNAICRLTEGYSGSDMKNLVKDASMGPLREALCQGIEITNLRKEDMRPVLLQDFERALQEVRPSVSQHELGGYEDWNKQFGSLSI
ncbi:fidgetin-like protein 1 isoform X1 [Amborella trichopoda]|uniref:AAA+ ATPase domain-containing protein n=2 Tax=Amborella trichopoda TaxID=13333 RepID=W1PRU0_AMBTC|nr:fidgetin-like protein 1 isoform X1 [Amborella trichopoda]ERN09975.1 hypothetical protein AMTR_s00013p00217890 [Amborella trichopoda]|eukprot:XP_006848394.1 fidgetin-like protein 1 isoform X1 [Amborella trichopoda]